MSENGAPPESESSLFGGLGPEEAGRRSWEKRREAKASTDVSQADIAAIVKALTSKALNGDVQASRELREWMSYLKEEGGQPADILSVLSKEQRAQVRAWLAE